MRYLFFRCNCIILILEILEKLVLFYLLYGWYYKPRHAVTLLGNVGVGDNGGVCILTISCACPASCLKPLYFHDFHFFFFIKIFL